MRHLKTCTDSVRCFEVKDDFSLVGVVDVLIADLVRDHSALDLGFFLPNQAEPNSHQRVDVSRLKERRSKRVLTRMTC